MSLVICSSAQDKYQSEGNLVTTRGQILPVSLLAPGMQNPAQFTNNINPVMTIPANSQVALKDISFSKNSVFKIGNNVSLSVYVGEVFLFLFHFNPEPIIVQPSLICLKIC